VRQLLASSYGLAISVLDRMFPDMNFVKFFELSSFLISSQINILIFYSESTLFVTEYIQPGITVNLVTENSFLAIVSSRINLTSVNIIGLGTLELRNDTYV
jgi:hypothetical protein